MAYLGDPDRPSTWRVCCDECGRSVKGKEAPRGWVLVPRAMPMRHLCPKCKRREE
jgi:hypothetical protein